MRIGFKLNLFPVITAFMLMTTGTLWATEDAELLGLLNRLADKKADVRAQAIQDLGRTGDPRVEMLLEYYRLDGFYIWNDQFVLSKELEEDEDLNEIAPLCDPLSGEPILNAAGQQERILVDELTEVFPSRKERKLARSAKFLLGLSSPNANTRLTAVKQSGTPPRQPSSLPELDRLSREDPVTKIRYTARESLLLIHLTDTAQPPEVRLAAIRELGDMDSFRAKPVLEDLLKNETLSPDFSTAAASSIEKIEAYQGWVRRFDSIKFGISSGSILVLMALGLAITFGLMGVINMAHGELMMIGAYATYCMQLLFGHTPEHPVNAYFIVALPVAFLSAAGVGFLIEYLVVRHLYRRPLESLLATYGVSLVLIQAIRTIFGDNRPSNSPTWLQGSFEVMQDMTLAYNRVFILALTIACVGLIYGLMRYTRMGLIMRATMQHRDMASSMGINTRKVDSFTFMLGSGLAGVAGYALITIGGITPDMGQNYIVDSFLVVVTGGVGELAGVVCSGMGLGIFNKLLEGSLFGTVWAKIIVLISVVIFIQFKPSGLFPQKGRSADV